MKECWKAQFNTSLLHVVSLLMGAMALSCPENSVAPHSSLFLIVLDLICCYFLFVIYSPFLFYYLSMYYIHFYFINLSINIFYLFYIISVTFFALMLGDIGIIFYYFSFYFFMWFVLELLWLLWFVFSEWHWSSSTQERAVQYKVTSIWKWRRSIHLQAYKSFNIETKHTKNECNNMNSPKVKMSSVNESKDIQIHKFPGKISPTHTIKYGWLVNINITGNYSY